MAHKKVPRERAPAFSTPLLLLGGAIVLALFAVGLFVFNGAGEPAGGRGPLLAVDRERIDFGKQPFDKMVRAEFRIENSGDRTLTLDASTPVRVLQGC